MIRQIEPTGISTKKNYEKRNTTVPKSKELPNQRAFYPIIVCIVLSKNSITSSLIYHHTQHIFFRMNSIECEYEVHCLMSLEGLLWLIASWPITITLMWPPSVKVRGCEVGHVYLTCPVALPWWRIVRTGCQAGMTQSRSTTECCLAPFNALSLCLTLLTYKFSHGNQFRCLGRIHLSINND